MEQVNKHSENPFGLFRMECENILKKAWFTSQKELVGIKKNKMNNLLSSLDVPPILKMGDLSSSLCS